MGDWHGRCPPRCSGLGGHLTSPGSLPVGMRKKIYNLDFTDSLLKCRNLSIYLYHLSNSDKLACLYCLFWSTGLSSYIIISLLYLLAGDDRAIIYSTPLLQLDQASYHTPSSLELDRIKDKAWAK